MSHLGSRDFATIACTKGIKQSTRIRLEWLLTTRTSTALPHLYPHDAIVPLVFACSCCQCMENFLWMDKLPITSSTLSTTLTFFSRVSCGEPSLDEQWSWIDLKRRAKNHLFPTTAPFQQLQQSTTIAHWRRICEAIAPNKEPGWKRFHTFDD